MGHSLLAPIIQGMVYGGGKAVEVVYGGSAASASLATKTKGSKFNIFLDVVFDGRYSTLKAKLREGCFLKRAIVVI